MSENYCPHCMQPASGSRCPHCGGDLTWRGQKGIDLPVGTVLTGGNGLRTYQIGAARGKGGFGITYVAREVNSGRRMAVKEYFPTRCAFRAGNEVDVQTMSGQEDVFRAGMNSFLDEGKMLLSQDDLTCVVHVIDYFKANGTAYLVMEYLDGVALHTQMARMGGRIPVSELMPRLSPLLRDIGQLHRRGVIHRDISPDNIMWMPDGNLKLLDFGSARSMENGKSMTVLMKHGFSPIEQYRSKGQGPYTDIYALAATIYYCVTGVIPPAAVERLDEDTLQSPTALGAALTVDQETALLWALSLQPNARPQSMEEFAARLYKESPAPPVPPAGWPRPGAPAGAGQQVPQGQPGGWQGGVNPPVSTGRQVQQGQPVPPGGWQGGVNPHAGTGQQVPQGQPGGWTGGVNPPPARPAGGGKSILPILIGAGAAVLVLIGVAIVALNWDNITAGGPTHSASPSHGATTSAAPSAAPSVEPSPDIVTGVTDDGFRYQIVDNSYVVLTGYETGAAFDYMPDDVDGLPITEIADGAFSGANTGDLIVLPMWLETIGVNAFRNCKDLEIVGAYSDVTTDATSFSGCDNMWFVLIPTDDVRITGWKLPAGVEVYYYGMETGHGKLADLELYDDDSQLVGETEDGQTLLMSVRPGTQYVDLDGVDRIRSGALKNLPYGSSVVLGEETLFDYESYYGSNLIWTAPKNSLSDMFLVTCLTAAKINAARPAGASQIRPDWELMRAATTRAAELSQLYDGSQRPNGEKWTTAVSERNIDWSYLGSTAGYRSDWDQVHSEIPEYIAGQRAAALTAEQSESLAGEYFTLIGAAYYTSSDGRYYFQSFLIVP